MKKRKFDYHLPIFLKNQIDCNKFEKDIDTFENYITTVNPRFKYNKHYLSNYINDLKELYSSFNKKEKIYNNILNSVIKISNNFILYLDTILFEFYDDKNDSFNSYTTKEFDSNQIISNTILVYFIVTTNNNVSLFRDKFPLSSNLLNNNDSIELDKFTGNIIDRLKSFLKSIQS